MSKSAEYQINNLIARCEYVMEDTSEDESSAIDEINNIMDELEGFYFQLMCTRSSGLTKDRTVRGIRRAHGWLVANMANLIGQQSQTNVTATAAASAEATVSVDMILAQSYDFLEKCGLPDDDVAKIKAAMADVVATKEKDAETILKKISKLFDFVAKGTGAAQAILLFVQLFMKTMS